MAEPMAVDSNSKSGLDFEFPFTWGKKRGMGGKKKDVQFYESFSFDGTEYAINDAVCLQSEIGGGEPHIGRLIKIWETRDKSRKVKVQWFFRRAEIRKYLVGIEVKPNELFLACGGDGAKGFANVNPLEAIVGKCNVVCISKDVGNPQPSDEAKADYVYYRFFDVVQLKVVDQIDVKAAAGTEVKNVSNK